MVEDEAHGRAGHLRANGVDHRQPRVHLDVPAAAPQPVEGRADALAADGRIRDAAGFEIQPDAANAGGVHVGEHRVGAAGLDVDDGDRPRARPRAA